MVAKFTEKDLEKIEAEAEINIYEVFRQNCPQLGLKSLATWVVKEFRTGQKKCAPLIWSQCEEKGPAVKRLLFARTVYIAILDDSKINNYERVCNNLEPFMSGSHSEAGPREKQSYNTFKYCKELSVAAMRHFADHFARTEYFGFSSSAYDQWFSSLRLGLYSNPERVLNGIGKLNYPDLNNDPSPRLKALKEYLEVIYRLRIRVQILDILVRNREHAGTSSNITMGQWENFVQSIRERLTQKFGTSKAQVLFNKMFGSDNPTAPTSQAEFSNIQNEILTKMSEAILADQMGQDWEPQSIPQDGFHRDYAGEQREREAREAENQRRRERENPDWGDINPQFRNNDPLVKEWTKRGFDYEGAKEWADIGLKPNQDEYAQFLRNVKQQTPEQFLNEGDMEQLQAEYQKWKTKPQEQKDQDTQKNNNIDERSQSTFDKDDDDKPKPTEEGKDKKRERSRSPSRQAAEDKLAGKETKPPIETGFNSSDLNNALNSLSGALDKDSKENNPETFDGSLPPINSNMPISQLTKEDAMKRPWICMCAELSQVDGEPHWKIHDNAWFSGIKHGKGDLITLKLRLISFDREAERLHNFFWAKNLGTEQNPIKGFQRLVKDDTLERERERDKLLISGAREDDPRADKHGWNAWPFYEDDGLLVMNIPGVKQIASRFTRKFRKPK